MRIWINAAAANLPMSKDYLEAAIEIAQDAGKILREEFDRPAQISSKGDVDLVTQADKRSEEAIVSRLTKYFPSRWEMQPIWLSY